MMLQDDIITQRVKLNLKTSMLKSSLCDYNHAYIPVKKRMTITGVELTLQQEKQMKEIEE